ncbi:N-acetyl-D-Glu racemase DgcA [Sphingomonas crusticola]|uniref:N-acetyl-D-Glu racemase DgcA n=1 Tax=Sphingomonas crusticola TaxID=1697973 RepID=UPI000E289921|nr:N-acetyl-D-Glu racemase DgcA [Sphingomonas crusticola]
MHRTLSTLPEIFPLSTPFRISRGTKTAAEVVTVQIEQDGSIGRGECVPYPRYGETVETTIGAIDAVRSAIERGAGREELLQLMPAGAARNAVDCALWDLEARLAGSDVATMLGLQRPLPEIATAMTVGLDTPEHMGAAAAALVDVPLLKVKVDRSDPAAQLRAVRAAAPRPRMIVDPNESWTIEEVSGLQQLLVELKVDLLEQPLPVGDDSALAGFVSAIPIAADESVHVTADLEALPDGYAVVNIKLDKTGGLTAALELAREARQRGLGVMTGCMICSSLSIAPALMIAVGSLFTDLDGPLWLSRDREGGVTSRNGWLSAPQPGFWGEARAAQ